MMIPFVSLPVSSLCLLLWNIICLCSREFSQNPYCPRRFLPWQNYSEPLPTCQYSICTIARKTGWKGMASRSGKLKVSTASQTPTFKVCPKCFALIYRGMLPLFFMIASKGCAHPSHSVSARKNLFRTT